MIASARAGDWPLPRPDRSPVISTNFWSADGRVIAGFGTSHLLFPPQGVETQAGRVMEGMLAIRRRMRELKPDLLVLAGSDHLNNFSLAMQVPIAVGIADAFTTFGDNGTPVSTFAGSRDFAEGFVRHAQDRDFDLVQAEELRPDHGMAIPKLIIDPANEIPTVPIYINAVMPVTPSPRRCHRLGGVLKEFVEAHRPKAERVVVLGLGGLSHWLRLPEEGRVAIDFDVDFMTRMIAGRSEDLAQMSTAALREAAGNGGLELTAWLFMAGALPGVRGTKLYYEPIPEWITGMGGLELSQQPGAAS